jgi:hypothetical protein
MINVELSPRRFDETLYRIGEPAPMRESAVIWGRTAPDGTFGLDT